MPNANIVIEISDADVIPLADFPLAWRFTRRGGDRWPAEILRRLRPLSPAAAANWGAHNASLCETAGPFDTTFRSDDTPAAVRQALRNLPPVPNDVVLVSWDARTALATDWELFVSRWDDFCYPSSDDVTVAPLMGTWVLCYRRYEVMQFRGKQRHDA